MTPARIGRPPIDPNLRFDSHVDRDGPVPPGFDTPCWLWTGAPTGNGYAQFWVGSRLDGTYHPVGVHRWNYERYVDPIPDGYQVDHLCKNSLCVNPAHLEAVPGRVNNARSDSPSAQNGRMTLCSRGLHELAGDNLQVTYLRRGERRCRTCMAERQREYRARKREVNT